MSTTMAFVPFTPSAQPNRHQYGRVRLADNVCVGQRQFWKVGNHRRVKHVPPHVKNDVSMSGVNGGIDYDIDLSSLPAELSSTIQYVQQGPDSPTQLIEAAKIISNAVSTHPSVLPVLVDMLGFNNPVAALICVNALASAGSSAIPPLLTGVAAFNYSVNAYALRALALIADPSTFEVCKACAVSGPIPNVRRAACKALGALRFEDSVTALSAFQSLLNLAENEPDWGVRYSAIVAIEKFHAISLLDSDMLKRAKVVLQAAATGCNVKTLDATHARMEKKEEDTETKVNNIDDEKQPVAEPSLDPAVKARATVALSEFTERLKSISSKNVAIEQMAI